MNVQALYLYPVKSLAGVSVTSFTLDDFGPVGDRRWMIVDEHGQFVTQRSHPELARVATRLENVLESQVVTVTIPGEGDFALVAGAKASDVNVWRDRVSAVFGDEPASAALSRFCKKTVFFVYMPDDVFRRVDPDRVPEYRRVSFADGFPFLVTNEASLAELNSRLEQPVEMTRFRPNIVISGAEAWAEDEWASLVIDTVSISLVKPCSRCIMTTVDPDSGVRAQSGQPLKTLATYRRTTDGVMFGVNGIHDTQGRLSVGDSVTSR